MESTLLAIKSLSDGNRLRIFGALQMHDELCACQITEFLGVAGATASRHLGLMVAAGVLKNRREGRWIYFRINRENPSVEGLLEWVKAQINRSVKLQDDLEALNRIIEIPCETLSQNQRQQGSRIKSEKRKVSCGEEI